MSGSELLTALAAEPDRERRRALVARLVSTLAGRTEFVAILGALKPALRMQAAGMALETVPDTPESVKPILDAITAKLGKSRTLQRLIELQSRVATCKTLDAAVTEAEMRTKLACPKCDAKLSRVTLIRHLWFKHRLVFEKGRAREPGALVEVAIQQAVSTHDPLMIDRVYELASVSYRTVEPVQIHQALTSRMDRDPEELEPLKLAAKDQASGLCPRCLNRMAAAAPLPPPLSIAEGRLTGEEYSLDLGPVPAIRRRAARWALPFAILGVILVAILPRAFIGLAAGTIVTTAVYFYLRRQSGTPQSDAVVDAAWKDLAPRVGRSAEAVRFLTRLCRTSLEHGEAGNRTDAVWSQVEQAAVLSGKGGIHLQWFAAVRVLQARDAAHFGQDWIPSLVGIVAPLFRAEASPAYAEAVAETLLESHALTDANAARLRVALAGEAFAAGLSAADLAVLGNACPWLDKLFAGNEEWFLALHAVWRMRNRIEGAETVFAYALNPAAGRVLASYPDTLLVDRQEDLDLGPVLIGRRGVTVADCTVSELNTAISLDGTLLRFGPHAIEAGRRLPKRIVSTLTGWLQFREDLLEMKPGGRTERLAAILAPLAVECPLCRQRSLVKIGDVNDPWPLQPRS